MGTKNKKSIGILQILGVILIILSIPLALYFAIWWGLIKPIITVATAIDNNTVTAGLIGWELCKFFLREFVAVVVMYITWIVGITLITKSK